MSSSGHARQVYPSGSLRGTLRVPGDKSISHRALLFNGLSTGSARIRGLLRAGDVMATAAALRALGCEIEDLGEETLVHPPASGLCEPEALIDCGNSGTSMRLLTGILAAQPFHSVLTGDASLRRRPMARVVGPLRDMGAQIDGRSRGRFAPLAIRGGELEATDHDLGIASAQVKSCLLLAGLRSGVRVREPRRSRDHTERLLISMGADLTQDAERWWTLKGGSSLDPVNVRVPADLSAAAFFLVAGCIVPGSEIRLSGVGMNPTRSGVVDALLQMGANLEIEPQDAVGPEPLADIVVRHGPLTGTRIDGELALRCLDELPVLSVAAAFAEGETVIADAAELRVKESDRIVRVVEGLRAVGVEVEEQHDGMVIQGGAPRGPAEVDATGDHRIAMAFAIAALAGEGGVLIHGADAIESSYPAFFEHVEQLCG